MGGMKKMKKYLAILVIIKWFNYHMNNVDSEGGGLNTVLII